MGIVVLRDLAALTDPNRPHSPRRPMWTCRQCGHPWPCAWARAALPEEFRQEPLSLFVYLGSALFEAAGDLYRLCPNPAPNPAELHARFLGWVPTHRMITWALARRNAALPAPTAVDPPAIPASRHATGAPSSARHRPDRRGTSGSP
ncbi:hypothetical protein ACN28C_30300 [Plantactinospora sp. WMMC1484]|uniref:hypothetical protein n=1 Tax=Plantactinospora sp. WMMC1484 TaxID=3404122 RepID=UPI003BF4934F